uniref:shikimate kinase n=1 Tax=uncultured prokaryote TaxID=198431 RepID=H5SKV6_9ZZZZ|nr:shikimate kinase [uncultured prokaryote]
MGCGKTTTGQALARRLGWSFVDLDVQVEQAFGLSVREIFAQHGEAAFRAEEARRLWQACRTERVVVATGGGTFVAEANRALMQKSGVSVFLDVPWGEILRRLPDKWEERPLFRSPEQALELYRSRLPSYRLADLTVRPFSGEDAEALAGRIALLLRGFLCAT